MTDAEIAVRSFVLGVLVAVWLGLAWCGGPGAPPPPLGLGTLDSGAGGD